MAVRHVEEYRASRTGEGESVRGAKERDGSPAGDVRVEK